MGIFFTPQCTAEPILKVTVVIPELQADTILKDSFILSNAWPKLF